MEKKTETFIRLMRPTFGYIVALSWGVQMSAIAFVILFKTENAAAVINAMGSLSATWAVGLSVLGVYVYKRSNEKKERENDTNNSQ